MSAHSDQDIAIQQARAKKEIVCPDCGARYMKKRHLCRSCGAVLDRDAGIRRLVGRTSVCVIDHIQAEEQERCARVCEELAEAGEAASDKENRRKFHALAEAIYIQSAAYRHAAKVIRGEEK